MRLHCLVVLVFVVSSVKLQVELNDLGESLPLLSDAATTILVSVNSKIMLNFNCQL